MRTLLLIAGLTLAACSQATPPPDNGHEALDAEIAEAHVDAPDLADVDMPAPVEIVSDMPAATIEPPEATPPVVQPVRQQALASDTRLVGTWVHENNINSPGGAGGFASFSTVMIMELGADGGVRQYTESAGGGGDWSYDGSRTLDFEGEWQADGSVLSVKGMGITEFTPAAVYEFSGKYLVTRNDQGRLIWQRTD